MLKTVIGDHEFVAVLFTGLCGPSEEEEDECTNAIEKLEQIDTNLDQASFLLSLNSLLRYAWT